MFEHKQSQIVVDDSVQKYIQKINHMLTQKIHTAKRIIRTRITAYNDIREINIRKYSVKQRSTNSPEQIKNDILILSFFLGPLFCWGPVRVYHVYDVRVYHVYDVRVYHVMMYECTTCMMYECTTCMMVKPALLVELDRWRRSRRCGHSLCSRSLDSSQNLL